LLKSTERLVILHSKLGEPQPGEWLYTRKEKGQTFEQYVKLDPVVQTEEKDKIYILPIGSFDEVDDKILAKTAEYVSAFFGVEVILMGPISDSIIPSYAQRDNDGIPQIHTKYILDSILLPSMPKDAMVYTAITRKDLYPRESWNFVFGQAYLTKKVGVSSMYRYKTEGTSMEDHTKCLKRLAKTSTHELTHMFSIKHCIEYKCLMNGSMSLLEADSKPMWLCPDCLLKFSWCTGYNIIERFDNLIQLDSTFNFTEASQFLIQAKEIISEK